MSVFKNWLFFVQKDTMNAWCLHDAIGGAVTQISLSGVFKKGGALLFGDSWPVDAAMASTPVFSSALGEVVAFGERSVRSAELSMVKRYDMAASGAECRRSRRRRSAIATIDGMCRSRPR